MMNTTQVMNHGGRKTLGRLVGVKQITIGLIIVYVGI